jgi:ribosomal protein L14
MADKPLINGETSSEVQARLDELKLQIDPTADNFNETITEYTSLLEHWKKLVAVENKDQVNQAKAQLASVIQGTVESLGLGELLQEQVTRVIYTLTPAKAATADSEAQDETVSIVVNPAGRNKGTRTTNGTRRPLTANFMKIASHYPEAQAEYDMIAAEYAGQPGRINSKQWQVMDKTIKDAESKGLL